ncbi:MAG: inositol monophosphatase [Elusimicrobiaceae bacterium]|nr:inositol monophosphatase [Elusimicrobiaceae bacterium]
MKNEFAVLQECLYTAGNIAKRHFGKVSYHLKGRDNLITKADVACQKAILKIIQKNFPQHDFLAEENGLRNTGSPWRWIIDPIDGTTNFAHHMPHFSTSIALAYQNEIVLGGVYDASMDELFLARKGRGATLNGKKIRVSSVKKVERSLLVTGFPYGKEKRIQELLKPFENFLLSCHDVRRLGSAALDLCWVASGRFDGYWEDSLNPWDVSAGKLILEEAGGKVTLYNGRPWKQVEQFGQQLLASNGLIHRQMCAIIKKSTSR